MGNKGIDVSSRFVSSSVNRFVCVHVNDQSQGAKSTVISQMAAGWGNYNCRFLG